MKFSGALVVVPRVVALLIVLLAALPASASESKPEILQLEEKFVAAVVSNDAAAVDAIVADDWKLVTSDGSVVDRATIIGWLKAGRLHFDSYKTSKDIDVRTYGDTAVVIGIGHSVGSLDGENFEARERFTDVFVKTDGQWKCVSTQTTTLKD
jgi:ketosteroid isomerase-like protein